MIYVYYLNQDDVPDMFPTADLHTQTHILTVTQSTHTWTAQAWAPRSPLQTSNTHTGAPRVGKQGRNKEKGAETQGYKAQTQGYKAQTQGPKGGFWKHTLELILRLV